MYATINGVRTYYEIEGSGFPVLTLHGGPGIGDHGDNKKMMAALQDEFSFIYWSMRGNGLSDPAPPETYTHAQMVEDTEALRRHLELGSCILAGGSYGGIVGLEYALKYQNRISGMLLRGTAASFELNQSALANALQADLPGVDREMLENLFFGRMKDDDDLREHFSKIYPLYSTTYNPDKLKPMLARRKFHARTHNAFFQREFPRYDIRDRLHEITIPVLILAGRHDWITPIKFAQELADAIPNAELVVFEDAGHSIHSDQPERCEEVMRDFFRKHSGG